MRSETDSPGLHRTVRKDAPHALTPPSPLSGGYGRFKAAVEFVLALLLLVPALPLIVVCAVLIRLTSRGPAFYSQIRLGLHGRPFRIWKLRTMTHNCEQNTGAIWSRANDPRVTWLGKILRKTHIDELPQLWNVLWGEMSLIGPRPERPEFVPKLEQAIAGYRERLKVRPGLTGLAQVFLPPDQELEDVRRKVTYDLYYLDRLSLWLDFRLLVCTGLALVGIRYSWSRRWLRLPIPPETPAHPPAAEHPPALVETPSTRDPLALQPAKA